MSGRKYLQSKFDLPLKKRNGKYLDCETCGVEFYIPSCRAKLGAAKYCSREYYRRQGENNTFFGKKHSDKSIQKMRDSPTRHRFLTGDNNPNALRLTDRKKKKIQQKKCERCGFNDIRVLEIHHKDRNRENNQFDNLEMLCRNCHAIEHYEAKDGPYTAFYGRKRR